MRFWSLRFGAVPASKRSKGTLQAARWPCGITPEAPASPIKFYLPFRLPSPEFQV